MRIGARPGFLVLLIVLAGRAAAIQTPTGTRIEGLVVDGVTERPIAAVSIQIAGLKVSSDALGRFALNGISAGKYVLLADKTGYLRARPEGRSRGTAGIPITVVSGQPAHTLALRLFRTGSVSGRIYDSSGNGLRMRVVIPYRATYDTDGSPRLTRVPVSGPISPREIAGTGSLTRVFSAASSAAASDIGSAGVGQTNDLGDFRITNLEPGRYAFYIVPMTNDPPDPMFYPGVLDSSRAEIFEVDSGKEVALRSITLAAVPEAKLRVQVVDRTNQRGAVAFVQVRRTGETETLFQTRVAARAESADCSRDPSSCVEVGPLAPGPYEVEAVASVAGASFIASTRTHLNMPGNDVYLELPVSSGTTLSGQATLKRADGTAVPVAGLQIALRSDEVLPNVVFPAVSDSNGAFLLNSIPAGVYRVRSVSGVPSGTCLDALGPEDRDVFQHGLTVADTNVSFNATLAESQTSLTGIVTDANGQRMPGAIVVLAPDDPARSNAYVSGISDESGSFDLSCVRLGTYRLFAWIELEGAAYRNSEFMKKYDGQGQSVNVQSSGRIVVKTVVLP